MTAAPEPHTDRRGGAADGGDAVPDDDPVRRDELGGPRHSVTSRLGPPVTEPAELSRAVRELRVSAAACGALAFVLRLGVVFLLQPIAWRMPPWLGLTTLLAGTLLAAGAPLAAYVVHASRHRRLPRTFLTPDDARDGRWPALPRRTGAAFQVPFSPWLGGYVVMAMAISAGTLDTERTAAGQVDISPAGWLPAALVLEAILMVAIWPRLRGPALELTPEGVVVRGWLSGPAGRTVPWDDIDSDRVPAPSRRAWRLRLPLRTRQSLRTRPPLRTRAGGRVSEPIDVGWLWVNPLFLLGAIQHYADHPVYRRSIGTPTELDRLRRNLDELSSSGRR